MAIEVITDAALAIVEGLLSALPDAADLGLVIPEGILHGYVWLDSWLPVHETVAGLLIVVAVMLAVFAARVAFVVVNLVRGAGAG